jgi:hypothetical protein
MRYPYHDPQPFTGNPPSMNAHTSDTIYTGGTAPHFQHRIDRRYGRQLAGLGVVQDERADGEEPAWAANELAVMQELDDTQGSGIFDPPGSHPNIWPDAGVFAAHFSIPGYSAREVMWKQSEVVDATTGRPIVPVPSGAVAIDNAAQIAWLENQRFELPSPITRANAEYPMQYESIVNVVQNPIPVNGFGADDLPAPTEESPPPAQSGVTKLLFAAAVVGVAGGAIYALTRKSMKKNRSRR